MAHWPRLRFAATLVLLASVSVPALGAEDAMNAPSAAAGHWSFSQVTDDAGYIVGYRLQVLADQAITGQLYRSGNLRLTLNCALAGITDVWIENPLGIRGAEVDVITVFDNEAPERRNWGTAGNGDYIGLWGRGGPFIARALLHDRLGLTVEMAAQRPAFVSFDLRGLASAVRELERYCRWDHGPGDKVDRPGHQTFGTD
jgi:hypothetical protein